MSAETKDVSKALERAYIYKLFSLLFYPTKLENGLRNLRKVIKETLNGERNERLEEVIGYLEGVCNNECIGELLSIIGEMKKYEPLERKLVPAPSIGPVLADLAGFYKAFNLKLSTEVPLDHISVELEFMANLALREAYALTIGNDEMLEIVTDAEKSFLRDHLSRTAAFVIALKESRNGRILAAATSFEKFVNDEFERAKLPKVAAEVKIYEGENDVVKCPFS